MCKWYVSGCVSVSGCVDSEGVGVRCMCVWVRMCMRVCVSGCVRVLMINSLGVHMQMIQLDQNLKPSKRT